MLTLNVSKSTMIDNCQFSEVWQVLQVYYLGHKKEEKLNCSCMLCFTPPTKLKAISYDNDYSGNSLLKEVDITQVVQAINKLHNTAAKPVRNYPRIESGWHTYCIKVSSQINIEDQTHPDNEEMPTVKPQDIVYSVVLFSRLLNKERVKRLHK